MRTIVSALLLVAVVGCGSKSGAKLRALADQANPVLIDLRKQAAVVLASDSAPEQVIPACETGISIAQHLAGLDFGDQDLGSDSALTVEDVLHGFSFEPKTRCKPESGDGGRDARCASWCRERFGQLAEAIDRVRAVGEKDGIKIEGLR